MAVMRATVNIYPYFWYAGFTGLYSYAGFVFCALYV